jgi:hypothetical protein
VNDNCHDLIVGPCREEIVREMALGLLSDAEGQSPREVLMAMSRAMGLIIGSSFSREMHDGIFAACLDQIAGWSKEVSK